MADSILYNEDCIRAMKRLASDSIDLILTDPPYNLGNFMKDRDTNLKRCVITFLVQLAGTI